MRIQVSHPELVPEVLEYLQRQVHLIVEQVGPRELEVSQLGSMNARARRLDLERLLQAWRATHPHASVEIVD